jgi:hypothetical protein
VFWPQEHNRAETPTALPCHLKSHLSGKMQGGRGLVDSLQGPR